MNKPEAKPALRTPKTKCHYRHMTNDQLKRFREALELDIADFRGATSTVALLRQRLRRVMAEQGRRWGKA